MADYGMKKEDCSSLKEPAGEAFLRRIVCEAYSTVAKSPDTKHPFPVGGSFAKKIGYPKELLDSLPQEAVNSFAGVSNVSVFADIPEGAVVVDIGCGAGLDSLIASRKAGGKGTVIGIDFSRSMIDRAREASGKEAGGANISFHYGEVEKLPVADSHADIVLANGVVNLNEDKDMIFQEIYRILRPGGALYISEIIVKEESQEAALCDRNNWVQ